jgi:hypothetical protein
VNFQDFLDSLPEITRELTDEDIRVLRSFLSSGTIIAILARVALERSKIAVDLIGGDLSEKTSDQALYLVGREQGKALGIQRALELLFELADRLVEENEEEEEDSDE